jgi:hypothetical protein
VTVTAGVTGNANPELAPGLTGVAPDA